MVSYLSRMVEAGCTAPKTSTVFRRLKQRDYRRGRCPQCTQLLKLAESSIVLSRVM